MELALTPSRVGPVLQYRRDRLNTPKYPINPENPITCALVPSRESDFIDEILVCLLPSKTQVYG